MQYLSKTARISVESIERLTIFYKFIFWPYRIMQIRSELISIAKLYTVASLYIRKTLYFLVSRQNIGLQRSKHEFTDISHQNKQGFEDRKLSGTDFTVFQQNVCQSMAYSANLNQRSLLFSYLYFRVYFAWYPPESFKIICLTCIWLKFVDTSFHSSQNPQQNPSRRDRHFYQIWKNRWVKLKTPRGLELGKWLAKSFLTSLWVKFGGNRKYRNFFSSRVLRELFFQDPKINFKSPGNFSNFSNFQ